MMLTGSLSMQSIIRAQGWTPWSWNLFVNPFTFVAFFVFFVAALAEGNRTPFDLPEAESELVAGFHTEYSSMKFGLFFLGEFANVITICSIAVTLFLGGWNGPWLPDSLKFVWFFVKLGALLFMFIWIRWTFPRLRYDQLMNLGWKVLLPVSIVNVLLTATFVYARTPR